MSNGYLKDFILILGIIKAVGILNTVIDLKLFIFTLVRILRKVNENGLFTDIINQESLKSEYLYLSYLGFTYSSLFTMLFFESA